MGSQCTNGAGCVLGVWSALDPFPQHPYLPTAPPNGSDNSSDHLLLCPPEQREQGQQSPHSGPHSMAHYQPQPSLPHVISKEDAQCTQQTGHH